MRTIVATTALLAACISPRPGGEVLAAEYPVPQRAVDADYVYWTTAHELQRTALDGGPIETLASNEGDPYAMVLGATDVYWATGPSNDEPAAIRKIPK